MSADTDDDKDEKRASPDRPGEAAAKPEERYQTAVERIARLRAGRTKAPEPTGNAGEANPAEASSDAEGAAKKREKPQNAAKRRETTESAAKRREKTESAAKKPEDAESGAGRGSADRKPPASQGAERRVTKSKPPQAENRPAARSETPARSAVTPAPARSARSSARGAGSASDQRASDAKPASGSRAMVPVSAAPPPARLAADNPAPARTSKPERGKAVTTARKAPAKPGRSAPKRGVLARRPRRMSSSRAAILSMTSQEEPLAEQSDERDILRIAQAVVMRLMALAWLVGTVVVWGRLVGYLEGSLTLAWHAAEGPWLVALAAAILGPVVTVGLWLGSSWGLVIWASALLGGLAVLVLAPAALPFGTLSLAANTAAFLIAGGLGALRAWRDRDVDD